MIKTTWNVKLNIVNILSVFVFIVLRPINIQMPHSTFHIFVGAISWLELNNAFDPAWRMLVQMAPWLQPNLSGDTNNVQLLCDWCWRLKILLQVQS